MIGAILNFYGYMKENKFNVYYDIGGTFFFIKQDTALTAFHLLNKNYFNLNGRFLNKQSFLVGKNNFIAEVHKDFLIEHKNIDLTIIKFPEQYSTSYFDISTEAPKVNQEFYCEGYIAGEQPEVVMKNDKFKILLEKIDLNNLTLIKQVGYVKKLLVLTLKSDDFDMKQVNTIQTSFGGFVSMSGVPLFDNNNKNVLGFLSHGDPVNSDKKDVLYAVDCTEIIKAVE